MNSIIKRLAFTSLMICLSYIYIIFSNSFSFNLYSADLQGTIAPNFELKDLNGKVVSLIDFKGKIVVLVFWGILCPPCRAEIPHLIELTNKWKDKDVVIIGLALEKDEKKLKKFVEEQNINYVILQANKDVQKAFGNIQAIPTMFILDKNHKIIKKFVGYTEKSILEKEVESLMQINPSLE